MIDRHEPTTDGGESIPHAETWASLYSLLAESLKHPDESFHAAIRDGTFDAELDGYAATLGIDLPERNGSAEIPDTTAAFDNQYVRLFEGLEMPFAPPIESVYREWHGESRTDGLLEGPPAQAMRARYRAIGASPPSAYQPDHLALLLEYASLVVESGDREAYRTFLEERFEWLPAVTQLTAEAAATAPFHRRVVDVVCSVLRVARRREDVPEPDPQAVETMTRRARSQVSTRPQGEWADR